MIKNLILLCGPNGVGKSTTGRELVNVLEDSAFVDSDLCSYRNPFMNTEGIDISKQFMQYMLTKYMECSIYQNVIWSYGFHGHRQAIYNEIMNEIRKLKVDFNFIPIILNCDLEENIKRMKHDNRDEARIDRAIKNTRELYLTYPFPMINTTNMTIKEAANEIIKQVKRHT